MTDQEKAMEIASINSNKKNRMTMFGCLVAMADWKDEQFYKQCVDEGFLYEWYIKSVFPKDATPIWTEEHIEELLKDFYVIPKNIGE